MDDSRFRKRQPFSKKYLETPERSRGKQALEKPTSA
jgi:hypothetical protein